MDAFDLLILLLFIGVPLIDGFLRRRRAGDEEADGAPGVESGEEPGRDLRPGPSPRDPAPSRSTTEGDGGWVADDAPEAGALESSASDMVPDDLWEILTGEQRSTKPSPSTAPQDAHEGDWSREPVAVQDGMQEAGESDWTVAPWDTPPVRAEEPVSTESDAPRVVSLEQPLEDPDVRHRKFHEKMDSLIEETSIGSEQERTGRAAPLRAALRSPSGLRQAIVLSEVLGTPVGLRPPGGEGGA